MSMYTEMVKRWAEDPWLSHEDFTKCGLCWKQKIQSDVAKKFLESHSVVDLNGLRAIGNEVESEWHKTSLYIRVQDMMGQGKTIPEIEGELAKEGIEI